MSAVQVLALLLFGREEALRQLLPTHEVAFQVLSGRKVEVNDFFRWPLLRVVEEVLGRFRASNREEEISVEMLRIGAVHIQWHDDRIEITNPGGFPEGVRLDNLLVTPRPRNPLLADAFKRARIVERTAWGIGTIFYEQLRNGRPAPNYERSNDTAVVLVLPGGKANLAFGQIVAEESQAGRALGVDELLLLNHLWLERRLTTDEASALILKPQAEARGSLQLLVEAGLIESPGERNGRTWHLSAAAYRRLGERAAYVRQRGFEPIQQEQMVLQYVAKHGRITRREAADLCQLNPMQAYRLLKKLERLGKIERVSGSTKGTRYGIASK